MYIYEHLKEFGEGAIGWDIVIYGHGMRESIKIIIVGDKYDILL